ncbi:hypothetical protein SLEP1_g21105 [Rubroshorea leprosula]|uniref:Reverse transcriptase domain-containing protein n=1 Tax=Rubroshorea leprosula TaxID=152421 RepID=A0AAV5J4S3_9ROSI|nr:hypothetical protein SLEP1_g21105 [Rubroshorea leprosula]
MPRMEVSERKRWTPKKNVKTDAASKETDVVLEFQANKEEKEWLKNYYVGQMHKLDGLMSLQDRLLVEGFFSIKVTPMGGNLMLIHCEDTEEVDTLLKEGNDWLKNWFEDVRPWSQTEVAKERFTWIRCFGVPLNVWNDEFFKRIGNLCGRFISVDYNTTHRKRLDMRRALISTDEQDNKVKLLKIKVEGEILQIRICEEMGAANLLNVNAGPQSIDYEDSEVGSWIGNSDLDVSNSEGDDLEIDEGDVETRLSKVVEEDTEEVETANSGELNPTVGVFEKSMEDGEKVSETAGNDAQADVAVEGYEVKATDTRQTLNAKSTPEDFISRDEVEKTMSSVIASHKQQIDIDGVRPKAARGDGSSSKQVEGNRSGPSGEVGPINQIMDLGLINMLTTSKDIVSNGSKKMLIESRVSETTSDRNKGTTLSAGEEEEECRAFWEGMASEEEIYEARLEGQKRILKKKKNSKIRMNRKIMTGQERRRLWDELKEILCSFNGSCWCIGGDFNAIRSSKDKQGKYLDRRSQSEFNDFIMENELVDLPLRGRKFTWYKSNGLAASRLDRFLVSNNFIQQFLDISQWGLRRTLSDHCPIILKSLVVDWGLKPFRVLNNWLTHPNLEQFVKEKWTSFDVKGWGGFRLKEKLKFLKKELKVWNKEVFGIIETQIEAAKEEIKKVDEKNDVGTLEETDIAKRIASFQELMEWTNERNNLLFQKARQQWLKEGDSNSKYFHNCVVRRRKQNELVGLLHNGVWVDRVEEVKSIVKDFFSNKFSKEEWRKPLLEEIEFNQVSAEDNEMLVVDFTEKEIKEAVWSCGGGKSPGPDGFNFNFIKKMWDIIKGEKENPQGLNDYRPISLIGCMYKILSKLLANRLRKVMGSIISENQTAFIGGRQIMDGIVITNEVIHDLKRRKKEGLIFKADFEKAYDNVDWEFLDYMLSKLGFNLKWRSWMKECLSTASISVLVNGSPTEEFNAGKGLRQGDPLSPFLFLVVAEALSGLVWKAEEIGLLKGIQVGRGNLRLTHLQFADDTILFSEASEANAWAMKCVMKSFEMISGLKVNYDKSWLCGLNVDSERLEDMATIMNCSVSNIPFKYLGVPVGANTNRISTWAPVIECVKRRLNRWSGVSLSFGGRIVLLKAVLSCLPVYFFSVYKAPKQVTNLLTKLQCNFLWGRGEGGRNIAWIKWDVICKYREAGGLGVRNVESFNKALLGKWKWRVLREKEELEDTIRLVSINRGTEDVWIWKWDNSGQYTVRSAYRQLLPAQQVQSLQAPFIQVWNPHVPLKVSALAWRALHDRLPTKSNLARRGVITDGGGIQCSNCSEKEETINHLMFECPLSWKVWTSCYSWWGISTAINVDTTAHFKQHTGLIDSKNINQAWAVIWFAALWSIWLQRNQVIFSSNHDSLEEMLELIKYRSFYWIRAMLQPELSLDLWKSNPRLALRMR